MNRLGEKGRREGINRTGIFRIVDVCIVGMS